MTKKIRKIFLATSIFLTNLSISAAATYPTIMNNLKTALVNIQAWLVTISTPAAAIGVITGVLIKKFSFGDTERMMVGRKLIRSSFVSYAIVIGIDLILKAIATFVTKK